MHVCAVGQCWSDRVWYCMYLINKCDWMVLQKYNGNGVFAWGLFNIGSLIKHSYSYVHIRPTNQKSKKKMRTYTVHNKHGHKFRCKSNFNGNFTIRQNRYLRPQPIYRWSQYQAYTHGCYCCSLLLATVFFCQLTKIPYYIHFDFSFRKHKSKNSSVICHAIMNMHARFVNENKNDNA